MINRYVEHLQQFNNKARHCKTIGRMAVKLGNNTYLVRDDDDLSVRLHETNVVTYHADGSITLRTGGWFSRTTKDRMNTHLPSDLSVQSKKGDWFVVNLRTNQILGTFEGNSLHLTALRLL